MYWKYQGISSFGEHVKGSFNGTFADCQDYIKTNDYVVLSIYPDLAMYCEIKSVKVIPNRQLIVIFDDLYHLLNSGMSLVQSLEAMKSASHDKSALWEMIIVEMGKGASFANALKSTQVFPLFLCCCIASGEKSGLLPDVLKSLSVSCKQNEEYKGSFIQALMYPMSIFVLLIGIASFISITVVPQIRSLVPPEKLTEPLTYYSLGFLESIRSYGVYVLAVLILTIIVSVFLIQKYPEKADNIIFKLPFIGVFIKEMRLGECLVSLTMLIKSGFSVIESIKQLNEIFDNSITRKLFYCRSYMVSGLGFAEAIKKDRFFPTVLVQALARAEQAVAWEQYLTSCAQYFQRKSQRDLTNTINSISPILLAMAGAFLMAVGLGFLLPIYGNLTSIAGN